MTHETQRVRKRPSWMTFTPAVGKFIDAINWEAPIVDELSDDGANGIHLRLQASNSINCLGISVPTDGMAARYRKAVQPEAWIYRTDQSAVACDVYKAEKEKLEAEEQALRRAQYEHAVETVEKQYPQITSEQRAQQRERNQAIKQAEAEDRTKRLAAAVAREHQIIQFRDGMLEGMFLEINTFPRPIALMCNGTQIFYSFSLLGFNQGEPALYQAIPENILERFLENYGISNIPLLRLDNFDAILANREKVEA